MMVRRSIDRARRVLLASAALAAFPVHAQAPADASAAELIELARVQGQLDELDTAEAYFLQAIELVTAAEGEFSPSLIDAYRGLAEVLARAGGALEAITVLEQARHVSQRNFGLFNLEQAEILDDLSAVYEQAGDTRAAQDTQREILNIAQRQLGADDPRVIPYHFRLAGYYELARMRGLAREQYERALEILEEDPDSAPGDALEPLTELVRVDTLLGETTAARRRLLELLEEPIAVDPTARANALAVLGDRELVALQTEEAFRFYREAHAAIENPREADAFFGAPRMIDFIPPPGPVDFGRRRNRDYAWGSITASFSLSAHGKARQISIARADPPGLMDRLYARRLAEATFRPRLVAGVPQPTPRLRYTHEFRYYVPEEE